MDLQFKFHRKWENEADINFNNIKTYNDKTWKIFSAQNSFKTVYLGKKYKM